MMNQRVMLVVSTLEGDEGERSIGPGRVMSTLARMLPGEGFETLLVSTFGPTESELLDELEGVGVRVAHLRMRSMWDLQGASRFRALVREWDPAVVHTRTIRADLLGRLASGKGAVVINNLVNLYPDDTLTWHGPIKGRLVLAAAKATTGRVTRFVANARSIVDPVASTFGIAHDRISVIHDGVDLERWTTSAASDLEGLGIEPSHKVVVTTARLHPQKGIGDLIEAAGMLRDEFPEVRYLVAGEGPLRAELEARIEAAGLSERFLLLGWRHDVAGLLERADLYALPSLFEGLPNAVIEAMASGTPVVATDVAGTPEIVDQGKTGWLAPPKSPELLADALRRALRADLPRVGAAARSRAEQHFSSKAMTTAFAEMYDELLDRSRAVA